jgi:uncharacterized protein (TIGR03083 family)
MDPDAIAGDVLASLEQLRDLVAGLTADEWALPTDCPGWDVHDVVAHVVGFESFLDGAPTPEVEIDERHVRNDVGRLNQAWVESLRDRTGDELVADLDDLVARRRERFAAMSPEDFAAVGWSPVGEVPHARFLQVRTLDVWFHEQDVREAVGRPGGLEGPAVDRALSEVLGAMGFVVGKRGGAPDGSSVRFELSVPGRAQPRRIDVVVDGRARVVDDLDALDGFADGPTATIDCDLGTFVRLVGGRRPAEELLDAGRVTVAGDRELGERIVRNAAYMI